MRGRKLTISLLWMLSLTAVIPAAGQGKPEVGIEERLGEMIPLDTLSFIDEEGRKITLKELFDKPVVLTLVYYRCPGICTPLLREVAKNIGLCELQPGEDYRLVTISFNPKETPDLAQLKKKNMLVEVKGKEVSPDAWRFLIGDEQNIRTITEVMGFHYVPDPNKVDFIHAATVMFLSPEGMIVRYLNGTTFNPADMKFAVLDASRGRPRSLMQKIQQLCYAYDRDSHGYVLKVNRLILGATLLFALVFVGFLTYRGGRRPLPGDETSGSAS